MGMPFQKMVATDFINHGGAILGVSTDVIREKIKCTTNGEYHVGKEIPDAMISDTIKKKAEYTYYMAKKVESQKAIIVDKPEEQHVSLVKSG
ncbi:hypothetical protein Tco_0326590 [Tanacetum coccineum]